MQSVTYYGDPIEDDQQISPLNLCRWRKWHIVKALDGKVIGLNQGLSRHLVKSGFVKITFLFRMGHAILIFILLNNFELYPRLFIYFVLSLCFSFIPLKDGVHLYFQILLHFIHTAKSVFWAELIFLLSSFFLSGMF